jgi:hypothetical protein
MQCKLVKFGFEIHFVRTLFTPSFPEPLTAHPWTLLPRSFQNTFYGILSLYCPQNFLHFNIVSPWLTHLWIYLIAPKFSRALCTVFCLHCPKLKIVPISSLKLLLNGNDLGQPMLTGLGLSSMSQFIARVTRCTLLKSTFTFFHDKKSTIAWFFICQDVQYSFCCKKVYNYILKKACSRIELTHRLLKTIREPSILNHS